MLVATCLWGNQHCFDQHHVANIVYSFSDFAIKANAVRAAIIDDPKRV
jgi:hypothetical protein